ncbi:MAG: polymer-forming cytoskeletal protein [Anaerolineales bacterium]|nr:polymer-forming cytoskeletal protein [Anaerolineales bacterium]
MQRHKTQRRLLLLLALVLLLIPTGAVLAAPLAQRVVGDGDVVYDDIVLFDENLELAEGGHVKGDIVLFNGNATIAGTVDGDVVLFNGDLEIADTAVLSGDCVLFNGASAGEGASSLSCIDMDVVLPAGVSNFVNELTASVNFAPPPTVEVERPSPLGQFVGGTAAAIVRSLVFALLAFAAASFFPQPMTRIEDALRKKPLASGAVGMLTSFSMPFVLVIFGLVSAVLILACGLGLLGFPIMFVMVLALMAAGFLGWFSVGNVVGEFLAQRLNIKNRSQAMTTALGTATITFVIGFLGAIPFVFGESLVSMAIVFIGLGATALTKFGTRDYPLMALPQPNPDKITAVLDTLPDKADIN